MLLLWMLFFPARWLVAIGLAVGLHELSHMGACTLLGIRVLGIKALPWGLCASTPLMYDPMNQLVVSLAGPMCNFFLLAFCPLIDLYISPEASSLFAVANLADGLLNLLPALPLDGGIVIKAFLCSRLGLVRGLSVMMRVTVVTGSVLMLLGIHIFYITGSNASYIVAGVFIIYNLRHEREIAMCIRKRILTGEITSAPYIRRIHADCGSNAICFVDSISPSRSLEIVVTQEGKVMGVLPQNSLVENVLKNSTITLGQCIEKN